MKMKIGKIKAKLLKTLVNATKSVMNETKFSFNEYGLEVNCVDESHACMVSISLEPDSFEAYDLKEDEGEDIGVELGRLSNGLSVMDDDEQVSLTSKGGRFIIKGPTATLSCAKIDTTAMEEAQMPSLPFEQFCAVRMGGPDLQKMIKALAKVPDVEVIQFSYKGGTLEISAKSDYEDLVMRPNIEVESQMMSPCVSTYDRELLEKIVKGAGEGPVTLKFSTDFPIVIDGSFGEESGEITMLVAPRVVDDIT
jgi:DNA polymerase III sliding clamp (beta) subunit (PCNA family)